jgi:hypothetical protein
MFDIVVQLYESLADQLTDIVVNAVSSTFFNLQQI